MWVVHSGKQDHDTQLTSALAFITARQQADGSFAGLGGDIVLHATILQALTDVRYPQAQDIANPLASWLTQHYQSTPPHVFFLSLAALQRHQPDLLTGAALGTAARLLVSLESTIGGPYYEPDKLTLDPATNALVAGFVTAAAEPLPNVTAYLQAVCVEQLFDSAHYDDPLTTAYYIAKALPTATPGSWVAAQLPHSSLLGLALAISSLRTLHQPIPADAITRLRAGQGRDGSWVAIPYCCRQGSDILTTALAIEALAGRQAAPTDTGTAHIHSAAAFHTAHGNKLYEKVFADTHALFRSFGPALYDKATAILQRIRQADANQEIILLPLFFTAALRHQQTPPPDDFFIHLGIANLCNWVAFTLYDDFYDEVAEPALLPVANAALHHSLHHFHLALPRHEQFQTMVHNTFDRLDSANAWEIASSRISFDGAQVTIPALPHFIGLQRLAERSYTHLLPILAVLAYSNIDLASSQARAIRACGRHYLISRQLNDDMHDWEEDLRAGNLTYTLATACRQLGITPGTYLFEELFGRIRRQFWQHTISTICSDLEIHIALGKQAATRSGLLVADNIWEALFASLQRTLMHTRSEHAQSMEFLQSFAAEEPTAHPAE